VAGGGGTRHRGQLRRPGPDGANSDQERGVRLMTPWRRDRKQPAAGERPLRRSMAQIRDVSGPARSRDGLWPPSTHRKRGTWPGRAAIVCALARPAALRELAMLRESGWRTTPCARRRSRGRRGKVANECPRCVRSHSRPSANLVGGQASARWQAARRFEDVATPGCGTARRLGHGGTAARQRSSGPGRKACRAGRGCPPPSLSQQHGHHLPAEYPLLAADSEGEGGWVMGIARPLR